MALVNGAALRRATATGGHSRWRILLVVLVIVMVVGLLVPLGAAPAAAAGAPRKASTDIWYAIKIGVVAVQANGTGQVNAFADRYVGGGTGIFLYEINRYSDVIARTASSYCSSSSSQRCWTDIMSDRWPTYVYVACATLVWAGHGQNRECTGRI